MSLLIKRVHKNAWIRSILWNSDLFAGCREGRRTWPGTRDLVGRPLASMTARYQTSRLRHRIVMIAYLHLLTHDMYQQTCCAFDASG
jgi:hypothetical protein